MIQRINFIEKQPFQTTYGFLLAAFFGSLLLCLLIFLTVKIGHMQANTYVKSLSEDINRLKLEREKLMKKEETLQGITPLLEIKAHLEKGPFWFQLLNSISLNLPADVWLVSFKTFEKEDSPSKKGALLNGQAKNPQTLSLFLGSLEKNFLVEKVVLTSSKEEGGVFNFSASCDISIRSKF